MLEEMTPRSMRVTVVAQKFEGSTDHVEKWYGTPYSINAIPEITLQNGSKLVLMKSSIA